MKIALIQCDVITGDLILNREKLLAFMEDAARGSARLCVAPFDALCGPEPEFFAEQEDFREGCAKSLDYLAKKIPSSTALLCGVAIYPNQAILVDGGSWRLVPEDFYFDGKRIFIQSANPPGKAGIDYDFIINPHAISFVPGKWREVETNACALSQIFSSFYLQPNLVGGYGDIIYAGGSFITEPSGKLVARSEVFAEDCLIFDPVKEDDPEINPVPDPLASQWQALIVGIKDYIHKAACEKAVLGLSGGMDSALVCCLARDALGIGNVIAVMMPSQFSSAGSVEDSRLLCRNLGIEPWLIPIESIMQACESSLKDIFLAFPATSGDLTSENIQPRIRGLLLMAIANRARALVLNTGNRSESFMGYSTLYGDTVGAISVLGDLYKTRIYELAFWYNKKMGKDIIPQSILTKAPSAELRPNQKDTDSLPPYEYLDPILEQLSLNGFAKPDLTPEYKEIRKKFFLNQFKRAQSPRAFQVGSSRVPQAPISGNFNPVKEGE